MQNIKVGDVLKSYEEIEIEQESGHIFQIPVLSDLVVTAVHYDEEYFNDHGAINIDVSLEEDVTVQNPWDRSGQSDDEVHVSETLNLDWEPATAAKRYVEIQAAEDAHNAALAKIREEYRASRAKLYNS